MLDEFDLERVFERVLESARTLTGAKYAALGVLDESRVELARFLTIGIDDDTRRLIGTLPKGRGVLGGLISDPVPLRLDDLSTHPFSYGFPIGHPPMHTFLGVPIFVEGKPFGNLYLTEKSGAPFDQQDEDATVLLADFAGVAIAHARRHASRDARLVEQERRLRALDATIQISRALGGETDLQSILDLVAKRGRALVSARALLIELARGTKLEIAACAGEIPAELIGRRFELEGTLAATAMRTRRTQTLSEDFNRARFAQNGMGHLVNAEDAIVVPLLLRDRSYGALVAIDQLDSGRFDAEHIRLLEAFAASAATAVATAHSVADERRQQRLEAAEAERARWARDLHDETLEGLKNVRVRLAEAKRYENPTNMSRAIEGVLGQLQVDIASLRSLITDLRPAALDELGLEPAVQALIDRVGKRGLTVDASINLAYEQGREPTRHAPELETALYRILQEGLGNAIKHGDATHAQVRIDEVHDLVTLVVRDHGSGFDPAVQTEGLGLLGMRERAELLRGELMVESRPGAGTTITAVLPVTRQDSAAGAATA